MMMKTILVVLAALLKRIDKQHGTHTIDWAEKISLGSKKYKIINIDK